MCTKCLHEFKMAYRGNRGIALVCSRCGKPAMFKKKYRKWFQLLNFALSAPLFYFAYNSNTLLSRFLFLLLALLFLLLVMPAIYGFFFLFQLNWQHKILEDCKVN